MARPHDSESRKALDAAIIPKLIELRARGMKYQAIAEAVGVGYTTVYRAINGIETYKGLK